MQVAGKSLHDSGMLGLSGLKLLWVSRKGAVLFQTPPEAPGKQALWRRLLSKKPAKVPGTATGQEKHDSALPVRSSAGTAENQSPSTHSDHMTVTIGGAAVTAPEHLTLQVGVVITTTACVGLYVCVGRGGFIYVELRMSRQHQAQATRCLGRLHCCLKAHTDACQTLVSANWPAGSSSTCC